MPRNENLEAIAYALRQIQAELDDLYTAGDLERVLWRKLTEQLQELVLDLERLDSSQPNT